MSKEVNFSAYNIDIVSVQKKSIGKSTLHAPNAYTKFQFHP